MRRRRTSRELYHPLVRRPARLAAAGALERVAEPAQDAAQDGDLAPGRRGARDELSEVALDAADRRVAREADAAQQLGELVEEAGDLVAGGARLARRARPRSRRAAPARATKSS